MTTRFFNLDFDVYVPGRWYLTEPTDLSGQEIEDVWAFGYGKPVELPGKLRIPLSRPGSPLDFDKTTFGGTPILSERAADVFRKLASRDIQLFPVEVQGQPEPYYLMNVARQIQCIDDASCEKVRRWSPEDGRPDLVGQYHVISGLRIDKSKVGEARVFRPWGYFPSIIVDGDIKDALEQSGVLGAHFTEV
jgi:hypothetical protein